MRKTSLVMSYRLMLLGVGWLWASSAIGGSISPPELSPNPALPTDSIAVEFTTGPCVGILGGENNPAITVVGNSVDILINGVWDTNIQFCNRPVLDRVIPIGSYPPGDYIVTVRFRYEPLFLPPQIEILGVLDLEVQGAPITQSVPGLSAEGQIILFILFLALGVWGCAKLRL